MRYDLALARFYSGDAEQAERDLDSVLSGRKEAGSVLYLRSTVRTQTPERNHVAELEALRAIRLPPNDEAGVLYALAKELEDLGEHDQSFSVLERAAKKRRDTFEYDVASVVGGLREIIDSTDAVAMAAVESGHEESGAIFILGMPRTGTTLTERMLLQSSRVGNAGELTDFELLLGSAMRRVHAEAPSLSSTEAALKIDFSALGRAYMQAARPMAGGGERFIDKMPANFMYCGMIAKALPNAKIIHLVRDPLDTCFAIYKTLFFKAYEFSYALDELAEYYIAYHRLMRHWHEIMPGRILDVSCEDLVTDTEVQARRLYDWCGLEWTEDALKVPSKRTVYATASAAQVRGPVHSRSVGSSRRHLERLAPLVEKLVAAGIMSSP